MLKHKIIFVDYGSFMHQHDVFTLDLTNEELTKYLHKHLNLHYKKSNIFEVRDERARKLQLTQFTHATSNLVLLPSSKILLKPDKNNFSLLDIYLDHDKPKHKIKFVFSSDHKHTFYSIDSEHADFLLYIREKDISLNAAKYLETLVSRYDILFRLYYPVDRQTQNDHRFTVVFLLGLLDPYAEAFKNPDVMFNKIVEHILELIVRNISKIEPDYFDEVVVEFARRRYSVNEFDTLRHMHLFILGHIYNKTLPVKWLAIEGFDFILQTLIKFLKKCNRNFNMPITNACLERAQILSQCQKQRTVL